MGIYYLEQLELEREAPLLTSPLQGLWRSHSQPG